MMNFIGTTESQFINLAACVVIEDVSDETQSIALITTVTGIELEIKGEDADALFARINLIATETENAAARMTAAVEQIEQYAFQAAAAQPTGAKA